MDNYEYIQELFRIVSSDSILVIDQRGQIKRIYCPFPVIVIIRVGELTPGLKVLVEAIKMTPELKDVYIIEGKAYYPVYFKVL
jgi:hypothetical protein